MTTGISTSAIRRLTAALLALLIAMPALAVIAQPASAHRQTTQRCDYDPISGQSFNCRQVPVSHTHPKPKPEPTCPAGTTGTPPDCSPIPSDNTNHDGNQGDGSDESDDSDDSDSSGSDTGESGSEEEQEEASGSDPQVPNHYSPPPDTSPRPPTPPPNHYSPPPDTSPRPDPEDDESESDGEETETEEGDEDDCLSGTFVSGDCESRPEGSPSGSEAEPAAGDGEPGEAGEGEEEVGEEGDEAVEDPCAGLSDQQYQTCRQNQNRQGQGNGQTGTGKSDTSNERSAVAAAVCTVGAQRDARVGLACDIGSFIVNQELDESEGNEKSELEKAADIGKSFVCSAMLSGGVVTGLTCFGVAYGGPIIVESVIDWFSRDVEAIPPPTGTTTPSQPDEDNGDDEGGAVPHADSDDESTVQTERPVQTPGTSTQTEPADNDDDNRQSGGGTGDAHSETEPSTTTTTHPVAVGPVTGLGGSADGNSVWLGWNAPATGPTPTAYSVLRTASGGAEQEVARVGGNAYFDSNVRSGVTYTYRIQAISGTLSGPISAPANVTIP